MNPDCVLCKFCCCQLLSGSHICLQLQIPTPPQPVRPRYCHFNHRVSILQCQNIQQFQFRIQRGKKTVIDYSKATGLLIMNIYNHLSLPMVMITVQSLHGTQSQLFLGPICVSPTAQRHNFSRQLRPSGGDQGNVLSSCTQSNKLQLGSVPGRERNGTDNQDGRK